MKTVVVNAWVKVLVTDEDAEKLNLGNRMAQTAYAARIQSYLGDAPLVASRESLTRVSLSVEGPKEVELVA